jgi:hypothetical protein
MTQEPTIPEPPRVTDSTPRRRRRRFRLVLAIFAAFVLVYLAVAYLLVPGLWRLYGHRHPSFEDIPRITYTRDGHPGDPLNVALIGTETQVKKIMLKAGWYPADKITLKSCLEIAEASVLRRKYDDAPVSALYFDGKKQALAFEQPVGDSPRKRNHVRFWPTGLVDEDGRPAWVGSATYDRKVGLSHTTGQITHHIGADVDAERDHLFQDLEKTGDLAQVYVVDGFHTVLEGRNGGGDPWHTDGKLYAGVIRAEQ